MAEAGSRCGLPHDAEPAACDDPAGRLLRLAALSSPDADPSAVAHAAFGETDDAICAEVARRTTSAAALHWLARHHCPAVRRAVATRPNLWLTTQEVLAGDPDRAVADALNANPTVAIGLPTAADPTLSRPAQGRRYTPRVPSSHH